MGPCRCYSGLGTAYDQSFELRTALSGCRTGLDQSCRAVLSLKRNVNTPTDYIYRAKLDNV